MYTATAASRALVSQVARRADEGKASRKDCAAAILYTAEQATRVREEDSWDVETKFFSSE